MTKAEFRNHVRFLASDGAMNNLIQRERLVDRPGNIFDGINTVFQLNNTRITGLTLYDENNDVVSATAYTLISGTGRIVCTTAPTSPATYADYNYARLTDAEMDLAISGAASTGFDPDNVGAGNLDHASLYALSYVYMAMASRASEYYTLSSAGKQVSKSEIFNHYSALAASTLTKATELRRDMYTDRGQRDTPADAHGQSYWVSPYILDSSGG